MHSLQGNILIGFQVGIYTLPLRSLIWWPWGHLTHIVIKHITNPIRVVSIILLSSSNVNDLLPAMYKVAIFIIILQNNKSKHYSTSRGNMLYQCIHLALHLLNKLLILLHARLILVCSIHSYLQPTVIFYIYLSVVCRDMQLVPLRLFQPARTHHV